MRIIGGRLKGLRLSPPKNLPVRPTTDMAKEALFNILSNSIDFEEIKVLDLFSGTGSISLEFASRGVPDITSVDINYGCFNFLKNTAKDKGLDAIQPVKADVFKFLAQDTDQYDLIFADAPFDNPKLPQIPQVIFEKERLKPDGMLIVEHPSFIKLDHYPQFTEKRKYGYSAFSFFKSLV